MSKTFRQKVTLALLVFALPVSAFAEVRDINKTTSRYLRTKYMCTLAAQDGQKPQPRGLDHFRMSRTHYGIADLYGDGNLDMFFGFSDDTFQLSRVGEDIRYLYDDNEKRSASNHQYSFYSTDPKFVVPKGTKYLIGRGFAVQDYNGDGIDDYVVAQWGSDYPPSIRRSNEVLLSTTSGYKSGVLPGGPGYNHGIAAGDIDEDGDVDVVVGQPTKPGELLFYVNDGVGSFSLTSDVGIRLADMSYGAATVGLWDLDHDGYLDLLVGKVDTYGGEDFDIASVYWGEKGLKFELNPTTLSIPDSAVRKTEPVIRNGEEMTTFPSLLDVEFSNFGEGAGNGLAAILESGFYSSWSLVLFKIQGRDLEVAYIDQSAEEQRFYVPWISACDLKNDGDMDIVYDHFGQNYPLGIVNPDPDIDIARLDKIIWENQSQKYVRRMIEGSLYFEKKFQPLLEAYASSIGVSAKPYVPAQIYFENDLTKDETFLYEGYERHYLPEYRFPYDVDAAVSAQFSDLLKGYGPKKSVAKTSNPNTVSPKVKEILDRLKKEKAKE